MRDHSAIAKKAARTRARLYPIDREALKEKKRIYDKKRRREKKEADIKRLIADKAGLGASGFQAVLAGYQWGLQSAMRRR